MFDLFYPEFDFYGLLKSHLDSIRDKDDRLTDGHISSLPDMSLGIDDESREVFDYPDDEDEDWEGDFEGFDIGGSE